MHKKRLPLNYNIWLPKEKMKYLKYIPKGVKNILDVGCGRGEWIWILKNKGFYVEGCDIDPTHISKSKKIVKKVKYADVQELSKYYSNDIFDFISCLHVLEHTYCPIDALKEMAKVTKKYILVAVPNARHIAHNEHDTHLYSWNRKTLKNLIKEVKFKKFSIYEDSFSLLPNMVRKLPIINQMLIRLFWGPNELVAIIRK